MKKYTNKNKWKNRLTKINEGGKNGKQKKWKNK